MRSLSFLFLAAVTTIAAIAPARGAIAPARSPRAPIFAQDAPSELDARARTAYRAGDFDSAFTVWNRALAASAGAPDAERGRFCYNLGNTAYRSGRKLEAVAWYTAALRLLPGDGDVWANLELARTESELEPADRGDLKDTATRLVSSTTRTESEWIALSGLIVLALCLAGEALRGGLVWRRLSLVALCTAGLSSLPLLWNMTFTGGQPMMVVETRGSQARAEPRADAKRLFDIPAGARLERLDALPGWVRVKADEGEVWVREGTVFDLVR